MREIVAIIAFSLAMTSVVVANKMLTIMIGEINRKRPDDDLISNFGFHAVKIGRIFREHGILYPTSNRRLGVWLTVGVALVCWIVLISAIGIIPV